MARKITLTSKTIHLIIYRLRQFFEKRDYVSSQTFYKRTPLCSQSKDFSVHSVFWQVEQSNVSTIGAPFTIKKRIWTSSIPRRRPELQICVESPSNDSLWVFDESDQFEFSPSHVKIYSVDKHPILRQPRKDKTVLSTGTYSGWEKSQDDQEWDRQIMEDMMEDDMRMWENEMMEI